MKKFLSTTMFAAAAMLLGTSCSNEELPGTEPGTEGQVQIQINLEGVYSSRAISDGNGVNKYIYAICSPEGEIYSKHETTSSWPTIPLVKGQSYKIVFWGQNSNSNAYTVDENMNVTVDYTADGGVNNDETRDAFFGAVEFTYTNQSFIDVTLRRPFAQLNVGVTKADWENAVNAGFEVTNSSVEVKQAASTLNLITGAVSNPVDVTYTLSDIPTENLLVDLNGDGTVDPETENYHWISMCYLLTNDDSETGAERATIESASFTFKSATKEFIFNEGLTNIPLQRNWRTNIVGTIFTGKPMFFINIDPKYYGDNNVAATANDFKTALANGGQVTLANDLKITGSFTPGADSKPVTIDLNGKTLEYTSGWTAYGGENGPDVTIKNGTLKVSKISSYDANFTFENVTFETTEGLLLSGTYGTHGIITVKNSVFKGKYYTISSNANNGLADQNYILNLENSTFEADETPLYLALGATVNATNCIFNGGWQGVFVRCGNYTFTGCEFNLNMNENYNGAPEDRRDQGLWSDGNNSEGAALLLGNSTPDYSDKDSYKFPLNATVNSCKFTVSGTAKWGNNTRTAAETPALYLQGRNNTALPLALTIDDASLNDAKAAGKGYFVNGNKQNITVNGNQPE